MLVIIGLAALATPTAPTARTRAAAPANNARLRINKPLLLPSGVQVGDLGGGQHPAVEPQRVHRTIEVRVTGVLRPTDPVLCGGTEIRGATGHRRVAGGLDAVEVQDSDAAGERDRDVCPHSTGERRRRVDLLLSPGTGVGDGEAGRPRTA